MNAPTQQEKKDACDRIVKMVRGRFLRLDVDRNCWVEIDDETARTKVAQAFQYRQRRRVQKETPDGLINEAPREKRKRKLSVASFLPDQNSSPSLYQSMRIQQPLVFDNSTVTLDELRWVLGSQPSLPPQQPPQQQEYWQQQPHQQVFHQPNVGTNLMPSDHLEYCDDYAIGMPATMRSRQNDSIQHTFPPINEMGAYVERMCQNAMSLTSAIAHTDNTGSFPMQARYQQRANSLQFPQESRITPFSQQSFQQNQHLNWHHSQPDCSIKSTGVNNPNTDTVGPTMFPSRAINSNDFQQSNNFEGGENSGSSSVDVDFDNLGDLTVPSNAAVIPSASSFDYPRFMALTSNFQFENAGNVFESGNVESQRQVILPAVDQNVYPIVQQPFLIDPIPLDHNEIAPPYDKVMDRMGHNDEDKP
jgi:hypothetical protein